MTYNLDFNCFHMSTSQCNHFLCISQNIYVCFLTINKCCTIFEYNFYFFLHVRVNYYNSLDNEMVRKFHFHSEQYSIHACELSLLYGRAKLIFEILYDIVDFSLVKSEMCIDTPNRTMCTAAAGHRTRDP